MFSNLTEPEYHINLECSLCKWLCSVKSWPCLLLWGKEWVDQYRYVWQWYPYVLFNLRKESWLKFHIFQLIREGHQQLSHSFLFLSWRSPIIMQTSLKLFRQDSKPAIFLLLRQEQESHCCKWSKPWQDLFAKILVFFWLSFLFWVKYYLQFFIMKISQRTLKFSTCSDYTFFEFFHIIYRV